MPAEDQRSCITMLWTITAGNANVKRESCWRGETNSNKTIKVQHRKHVCEEHVTPMVSNTAIDSVVPHLNVKHHLFTLPTPCDMVTSVSEREHSLCNPEAFLVPDLYILQGIMCCFNFNLSS